jgi:hypothetical protein
VSVRRPLDVATGGATGVIYAGPLDPPAGVTTSTTTQRNLIFQPAAGYPIVISSPGSYVLAEDIGFTVPVLAGQDAIHITGPGVTLDLDGHTVSGGGGTANNGIVVSGGGSGGAATIRNGIVTGFFNIGIDASGASYNTVEDVAVSGAPFSGAGIVVGDYGTVSNCLVVLENNGIVAAGIDSTIKGSRVSANRVSGIKVLNTNDQIIGNYAADNQGAGVAAEIYVAGGTNDVVEDNSAYNNAPGKNVFRIASIGDVVLHNVARSGGGLGTDYVIGAGNDVGPITTAAAAGAPDGNVAE